MKAPEIEGYKECDFDTYNAAPPTLRARLVFDDAYGKCRSYIFYRRTQELPAPAKSNEQLAKVICQGKDRQYLLDIVFFLLEQMDNKDQKIAAIGEGKND